MWQYKFKSKIGMLYLVASQNALHQVSLNEQDIPLIKSLNDSEVLTQTVHQLEEYFSGKRKVFDLPLDPIGSNFQKKVWQKLNKIPFGKTCSYKDIAIQIKQEKACRAVGNANGKNPICIIIPCHRVIASGGGLGGYSGGLDIKIKLLRLEQTNL